MQQLGIGRKGDGLRLNRGVDRDALEVLAAQRAGLVRHPQALGQQEFQLVAEPLAPMAQVSSLVKNWKYGSWTQRSHTPSSDSPKMCLSNSSPIMKRVSIPGRPFSL